MKNFIFCILLIVCLSGCAVLQNQADSNVNSVALEVSSASGPEGVSKVEVSDRVILFTPGQDYSDLLLGRDGLVLNEGGSSEGLIAAVDPSSVEMPAGIPIYPNIIKIEEFMPGDLAGKGAKYIIYFTSDSVDQVTGFYLDNASTAGYDLMSNDTTPDESGAFNCMWSNATDYLILQDWQQEDGTTKVKLSWMPNS